MQNHARMLAGHGREPSQGLAQGAKEQRQPLHVALPKGLFEYLGHDQAIFQRVASARGCLGAIAQNTESARSRADHVRGVQMQPVPWAKAMARPQESRVAQHQTRGQKSVAQKLLRAIEIGQYLVQQPRSLGKPRFEPCELVHGKQRGNGVETPGAFAHLHVAGHAVGDTVVANQLAHLFGALAKPRGSKGIQKRSQRAHGQPHLPGFVQELVPAALNGSVAMFKVRGRRRCGFLHEA